MTLSFSMLALVSLSTVVVTAGATTGADRPALGARNSPQAIAELCRLARRGDAESQYELGWLYANSRGSDRRDDWAAYLFTAASLQGHVYAEKMLRAVTWPVVTAPDCFAVASTPMPATGRSETPPPHIEKLVRELAPQFKVPPQLVLAIIAVESNFDVTALSPKNAMGLMQLIPQTAKRFGVRNAFDPQQNIRGGLAYLQWLLAYFEGDVVLVAAAYNAGEGAVNQYRGVPPFAETKEYVRRVISRYGTTRLPFDASVTAPSPQLRAIGKVVRWY